MPEETPLLQAQLDKICHEALDTYAAGYEIRWLSSDDWEKAATSNSESVLIIPPPSTPGMLFVVLHEIGHVFHMDMGTFSSRMELTLLGTNPEQRASLWAKEFMESRGVPVPAECWLLAQMWWNNFAAGGQPKWNAK